MPPPCLHIDLCPTCLVGPSHLHYIHTLPALFLNSYIVCSLMLAVEERGGVVVVIAVVVIVVVVAVVVVAPLPLFLRQ